MHMKGASGCNQTVYITSIIDLMNGRAVKGAKCTLSEGLLFEVKLHAVYHRQAKHFFSVMILFISHPLALPASVNAVSHLL